MVGYVRNSTGDTYRMIHLDTERVTSTRDAKWTNKLYGEMIGKKKDQIVYYPASEDDETDGKEECEERKVVTRRNKRIQSMNTTEGKVIRALKKLNVSFNPVMSGMVFEEDVAMVGGIDESYNNPDIFQEVWNHPYEEEREHWRTAIKEDFNDMTKREVWRKANVKEIPIDRRLIGSKWVF